MRTVVTRNRLWRMWMIQMDTVNATIMLVWDAQAMLIDVKPDSVDIENKLSLIPVCVEEGREVVIFDEELVMEGIRKWSLTLCGHFLGFKMSYYELRYNLIRMWGKFGLKEIVTQNDVFLFKFRESEGMDFVLENGPWMVNNKPLIVQKWDPDVIIDKSDPKSLPCWIKLYNVPLEAWTVKGISTIASGLGKPLIMDKTTTKMCRGGAGNFGYARVLVEIQADKDFKEKLRFAIREKGNDKTQDGFRRVRNGFKSTTRMGNGEGQDKVQEQWETKWMNDFPDEEDVFDEETGISKSMTNNELDKHSYDLLNKGSNNESLQ
ncbi:zinc knuckle CX2CX4HX4C containing protein [Tanacetum coccineum]